MTCSGGGDIFNYLGGIICEIRQCQGNDYMLSSALGGWNIYVLDVARLASDSGTMLPGMIITKVIPHGSTVDKLSYSTNS